MKEPWTPCGHPHEGPAGVGGLISRVWQKLQSLGGEERIGTGEAIIPKPTEFVLSEFTS